MFNATCYAVDINSDQLHLYKYGRKQQFWNDTHIEPKLP